MLKGLSTAALRSLATSGLAFAQESTPQRPNILVIWGDDVGQFNVSAYNRGMMGYHTPNIDRIAEEGALITDWYGQQSCPAGRAAFITGQSPIRTGLTKVGLPRTPEGMQPEDPTIATLLKPLGYMTGQYGKNHLGDRDEMLPTAHGFDEFFGNFYHLNAEEEPENPAYPADLMMPDGRSFKETFGPRGVIRSSADATIEDTGPLTRQRMETIDEEITEGALDFMQRAHDQEKPFFLWWNSSRMHIFTHLKEESQGVTGYGVYADGMVKHDGHIGQLLDKLDQLGIAENTIVMYSSDNGAETFTWPDGGTTMFRGEKNTNWEGGYRVPTVIRWPGVIEPGIVVNDIAAHEDMLTTLVLGRLLSMAAAPVQSLTWRPWFLGKNGRQRSICASLSQNRLLVRRGSRPSLIHDSQLKSMDPAPKPFDMETPFAANSGQEHAAAIAPYGSLSSLA